MTVNAVKYSDISNNAAIHCSVLQGGMSMAVSIDITHVAKLLQPTSTSSFDPLCVHLNRRATVIGTLAVDGWAVTFGTARRGPGGLRPRAVLSSLCQM